MPRPRTRFGSRGFLVALMLCAFFQTAQATVDRELRVERIGPERGLPSGTITAVYQDRAGFLWIGTREGLAVYDGYSTRVFDHALSDPHSLSDNYVRAIYEDSQGGLWIGTDSSGLNRLDRATWRFESFRHDSSDDRSLSNDTVNVILEDSHGRLWVGTNRGLNRLDRTDGSFDRWFADPDDPDSLPLDWIYALFEDDRGALWIGTVGAGLGRMDPATGKVERFGPESIEDESNLVFALAQDPHGQIWVGTQIGVLRVDPRTRRFVDAVVPRAPSPVVAGEIVTSMVFDERGRLWIATWGNGLQAVDMDSRERQVFRHEPDRSDSIGADRVTCITRGTNGDFWIGTWGGGINRFRSGGDSWHSIAEERPGSPGLSYRNATAVLEDRAGRLWVGTWAGGLQRRDPGRETFERLVGNSLNPNGLSTVLSLAESPDGTIWAGAMAGLTHIDPVTGEAIGFPQETGDPDAVGPGYVRALLVDRAGRLWVGTLGSGLFRQHEDGEGFEALRHDPDDAATLSGDSITSLAQTPDGQIWVGTRSGGLNALDPATGRCRRYQPDPANPNSLSHHFVVDLLVARDGTLWVATSGGGVNRLVDAGTGVFERITEDDGLVNDNAVGLVEDDDGSLWVTTRHGLSRFDPVNGRFSNFGEGDGLPSLEFATGGACKGPTSLYMATAGGVVVVPRGSPFVEAQPSPVLVTAIGTLEGPIVGSLPPWRTERVEIPYGSALMVRFAVLDYRHRHRYAYRLGHEGDPWIELGSMREPTFANLRPGTYELFVRGRNSHGVWAETPQPLVIRVVPPFWMTDWFRGASVLALVLLAWTAHKVRTSRLEERNRELERLKNEREEALSDAQESRARLQDTYERLRRLTRRLEDAKEHERRRIARELHDEMGQALSATKINLQRLARRIEGPDDARLTADAIGLVDGLIGRVRALSLDLRPPLLDELGLVAAIRGFAEGQMQRTGLKIRVTADNRFSALDPDIAMAAFRLVQEALTNIVRHANAERVEIEIRDAARRLELTVRDDGRGFDLDQTLIRAAQGKHLGLLGMRERVEALGGVLEIRTSPDGGTMIQADLPWSEEPVS